MRKPHYRSNESVTHNGLSSDLAQGDISVKEEQVRDMIVIRLGGAMTKTLLHRRINYNKW